MTREIAFEPSFADVLAAYRLTYRTALLRRSFLRPLAAGTILFAGLGVALQWHNGGKAAAGFALTTTAYWLAIITVLSTLRYLLLGVTVRRIYAQQKALHDVTTVAWSDDGVTVDSSRGTVRHAWSDFIDIHADARVLVLRQSDAMFNFIPRRVLTGEQADDLLRAARG